MKRLMLLCILATAAPAFAQSGAVKDMDTKMDNKGAADKVHKATGVITRVDKDKVTIKHEPVPSINWPGMTMAFLVKDKTLMEKMKNGQKIDFEFAQQGRDYVVTGVK
jgi:Cu(I)/Ag(I) efflux system periplasmic protein CusF